MSDETLVKKNFIEGVSVIPLRRIPDERGAVYHMMKSSDSGFIQFGETYGSWIHPNAIKGWHLHKKMTLNYAVPVGKIKLVLYDVRENSLTKGNLMEIYIGKENYVRVSVPPGVFNGFKGIGSEDSLVINISTHEHDPDEIIRLDPFSKEIPYNWDIKHG